jgi:hypothetical protein
MSAFLSLTGLLITIPHEMNSDKVEKLLYQLLLERRVMPISSANCKQMLRCFIEVKKFSVEEVKVGILHFIGRVTKSIAEPNSRIHGWMITFDLYAFNRFFFEVPETQRKSSPWFASQEIRPGTEFEIWPWVKQDGVFEIAPGVPSIGSKFSYSVMAEFDDFSRKYGKRKKTLGWE